jgi:O-phosphoseryl-tRNA(Cys) synthetase
MKYMFFESSRITDKQEKYEKIRAYDVLDSLQKDGITGDDLLIAISTMLSNSKTDFNKAILTKALLILKSS